MLKRIASTLLFSGTDIFILMQFS